MTENTFANQRYSVQGEYLYFYLYNLQCAKSVQIRSFSCSVFSRTRTEYAYLQSKSPFSVPNTGKNGLQKTRNSDGF